MAELILGVTGLVLAWKGILDFGDFIVRLTGDDVRRREQLFIRLEVSQYLLKDWGSHWGLDRNDGAFHKFEPARKALILKIIFQLHDSRVKALDVLRNRYGILGDADDKEERERGDGKRLLRMISRIKDSSKSVKTRSTWIFHDQAEITDLVKETMELHESLQYLTYGSLRFIQDTSLEMEAVSSLQQGLHRIEHQLEFLTQSQSQSRSPTSPHEREAVPEPSSTNAPSSITLFEPDDQSLASFASRSIISSTRAGLVQSLIDRSFDFLADARIPEAVIEWWNHVHSQALMMEATELDDAPTVTCASVYYLARGPKLIYIFQDPVICGIGPDIQLVEMLRTLILRIVVLVGDDGLGDIEISSDIINTPDLPSDLGTIRSLITLFQKAVHGLVTRIMDPVLLIIDGIDVIGANEDSNLTQSLQFLVERLLGICAACDGPPEADQQQASFKILLASRGHATALYKYFDDHVVLDLTSYPCAQVNILQEVSSVLM